MISKPTSLYHNLYVDSEADIFHVLHIIHPWLCSWTSPSKKSEKHGRSSATHLTVQRGQSHEMDDGVRCGLPCCQSSIFFVHAKDWRLHFLIVSMLNWFHSPCISLFLSVLVIKSKQVQSTTKSCDMLFRFWHIQHGSVSRIIYLQCSMNCDGDSL